MRAEQGLLGGQILEHRLDDEIAIAQPVESVAGASLASAASRSSSVIRPRSTERAKKEPVCDRARSSPSPSTS